MDERPAGPSDVIGPADVPDPASIADIEHYELDGIPLYRLPMAGATIMTLAFRVGRADEPVVHGGMTHLAEHLILTAINNIFDHANGTTEPYLVTFVTRGSPREVATFLRDVCASIEKPRLARMHQEANVLRTEAAGRGGMGMSLRLVHLRTGYQGMGAVGLPEFFLDALDEDRLRSWIATNLVDGNAAIWVAGELPDDLLAALPSGPRRPPPEIAWIDGFETPTAIMDDAPGVGVSFHLPRTHAAVTGFRAMTRQLTQRLRVDRGLGYDIGSEIHLVGPDFALATAWATCLPEATKEVQQIVLESIDDVAARGPSPDDMSRQYQVFLRDLADPISTTGRLDRHVRNVLLGGDPEPAPVAQIVKEQWRLESEQVAAAFRDARESLLLLLPTSGVDPQRSLKRYPGPTTALMGNRTFNSVSKEKRGVFRSTSVVSLTVGDVGVSIDSPDRRRLAAVRWSDCVALFRQPGVRAVLGRDGTTLQLGEDEWVDGAGALRMIDRLAPPDVVVTAQS